MKVIFLGGSTLYIETTINRPVSKDPDSKDAVGSMQLTGNLGDVMKESANIAYTFAKSYLTEKQPENMFLQKAHLHLHVPEVSSNEMYCYRYEYYIKLLYE